MTEYTVHGDDHGWTVIRMKMSTDADIIISSDTRCSPFDRDIYRMCEAWGSVLYLREGIYYGSLYKTIGLGAFLCSIYDGGFGSCSVEVAGSSTVPQVEYSSPKYSRVMVRVST